MNWRKKILTCDLWIMIYIMWLHQQDRVIIRIQSKQSCLRRIFLHTFCLRRILFINFFFCSTFNFSVLFALLIHWYWKWSIFKHSMITTTRFVKITYKKESNNKPVLRTNLVRYKSHNTNSIPKQLMMMMMIAFITFKSSLVPLLEGLWSSNSWEFEVSGFKKQGTSWHVT